MKSETKKDALIAQEHLAVTRRYFLQMGAAAAGVVAVTGAPAQADELPAALHEVVARLQYLTLPSEFQIISRGKPRPDQLSAEKRREVGLDPETWTLEVVADPESDARLDNPLTRDRGTALNWDALMKLAETRAVRYLKAMTCTNVGQPLGMGLWEGVPLRDIVWLARPVENVRRVFYWGYHNDDPTQRFQSSLPIGRVLEDPPGEHPVILCYKLNEQWLAPENGAPVRMIVPDKYGNQSVKWLQRIVLTNRFQSNDTYAEWNNDTESHAKTYARFLQVPSPVSNGQPIPVTGVAQVGMSGLSRVQVWLQREGEQLATNDPHFQQASWRDAVVLPPPERWGGGVPDSVVPAIPSQIDPGTGRPLHWPLRDTLVHWAVLLNDVPPGKHTLRCRTVDSQGLAQPWPRPFPKGGANQIQAVPLEVRATSDRPS